MNIQPLIGWVDADGREGELHFGESMTHEGANVLMDLAPMDWLFSRKILVVKDEYITWTACRHCVQNELGLVGHSDRRRPPHSG